MSLRLQILGVCNSQYEEQIIISRVGSYRKELSKGHMINLMTEKRLIIQVLHQADWRVNLKFCTYIEL